MAASASTQPNVHSLVSACTDQTWESIPQIRVAGAVGRLLSFKETHSSPKAVVAIMVDIDALAACGAWGAELHEYEDIMQQHRRDKTTAHIGEGLGICTIKHSELPESKQRWKGRFCFRAPPARDEGAR